MRGWWFPHQMARGDSDVLRTPIDLRVPLAPLRDRRHIGVIHLPVANRITGKLLLLSSAREHADRYSCRGVRTKR